MGAEAVERPLPWIADLFIPAGYAVLVPERQGHRKSAGQAFSAAVGAERGAAFLDEAFAKRRGAAFLDERSRRRGD